MPKPYIGRLAPTPTGFLHRGHARTFATAWRRAREAGGRLIYREEDLDPQRCKSEFADAAIKDLRWLGLEWDEGPDCGGPHAPYRQSERTSHYLDTWRALKENGYI
ncbi:MAG: glutamate--tRNA ligase family protein, partial [Puniceicoccales bacterium]